MTFFRKILSLSFIRMVLGTIVLLGSYFLAEFLGRALCRLLALPTQYDALVVPSPYATLLIAVLTSVFVLLGYYAVFKWMEQRPITELGRKDCFAHWFYGLLLGAVLQTAVIAVIYLKGGYTVDAVNGPLALLPALAMSLSAAFFEEALFRGVIFRVIEERLGTWISLIISACIFGFGHLMNDNSVFWDGLAVSIEAGLMLGAAYVLTRKLWFPISIHLFWNFFQGGIFGASVSGTTESTSLIEATIEGSKWVTGGAFGPEGSVQAVCFCTLATLVMLWISIRQGKIVKGKLLSSRNQ